MPDKNWQFELEEYIKQGEPERAEKSEAWQTAIGLQAVDGLKTSEYLLDTAKDHIEGKITIDEAQKRIHSYYEQRTTRTEIENETKEADIVSARITKLLGEKAFQFSPAEWITIHRRLFEGCIVSRLASRGSLPGFAPAGMAISGRISASPMRFRATAFPSEGASHSWILWMPRSG